MKGLTVEQNKIVSDIINQYKNCKFYAYGSRVKGNFVKSSDLDILVKCDSPLSVKKLEQIKEDFYQSLLPFIVNIADYYSLDNEFYKIIEKDLLQIN